MFSTSEQTRSPGAAPLKSAHNSSASQSMMHYSSLISRPVETMRNELSERMMIEQRRHQNTYHPSKPPSDKMDMTKFESTSDGDVVVVEPSFDAEEPRPHDPVKGDENVGANKRPLHRRDLSAHFFDATRLTEALNNDRVKREYPSQHARPQRDRAQGQAFSVPRASPSRHSDGGAAAFAIAANAPPMSPAANVGNKHRRGPSGGFSNPSVAHRRINSIGDSAQVDRNSYYGGYQYYPPVRPGYAHHRREDSAGLDILSAVADESKEQLEMAAGKRLPGKHHWSAPEPNPSVERRMAPPQPVATPVPYNYPHAPPSSYSGQYGFNPSQGGHPPVHYYHQDPFYPPAGPPHHSYHHPSQRSPAYPTQYAPLKEPHHYSKGPSHSPNPKPDSKLDTDEKLFNRKETAEWRSGGKTTGSQTFVTAISVGDGNRTVVPAPAHRNNGANSEVGDNPPIPASVGHHRKLSSYSSLGTLMGSALFPDPEQHGPSTIGGSHHRSTSSSASLLQGLDGDIFFMQNLQSSTPHGIFSPSFPNSRPSETPSLPVDIVSSNEASGHSLAEGGTSKRIRRKCTVGDCANRVVQGGLCISHGAKRKICKYAGCNKNVKKAGLCSTHGPARKRCENRGCGKVAVQGGRCIAHGAKKKLCDSEGCTKQAILSGMCKKHHDAMNGVMTGNQDVDSCIVIGVETSTTSQGKTGQRPSHTRGLSIFQEISAESVQTLLSTEDVNNIGVHPLKQN